MINANASKTTIMEKVFRITVEKIIDGEISTLGMVKVIDDLDFDKLTNEADFTIGDVLVLTKEIEVTLKDYFNGEAKEQLLQHLNRKAKLEMAKLFMLMHQNDRAYIVVEEEDVATLPKWFLSLLEVFDMPVRINDEDFYFQVEEGALVNTKVVMEEDDENMCVSGDGQECSNCGTCCDEEDDMYDDGACEGTCEGFVCEDCEHNKETMSYDDFTEAMSHVIDILLGQGDLEEHLCTQCGGCGREFN